MRARASIMAALLLLASAPAWAGEGGEQEPTDTREVKRLLAKAELEGSEAVALLALPEALQRRVLKALAGEGAGVFDSAEWNLLRNLPEPLQARIRDGGRRKEKEGVRGGEGERGRAGETSKDTRGGEGEKGREGEAARDTRGGEGETGRGGEKPIDEEKKPYPLQHVKTDLLPFGARMFAREAEPMPLAPTIPVPSDYVLGPGDVLLIHYWNALADATYTAEITAEGRVTIPKGGEVTLGGLTMEAGQKLLEHKIRGLYKDSAVTVSLHTLR
ncbi:MAG: polysaccharide biosynthesis/export family protein, partial [Planctomycetota bacterium]